MPAETIVIQKKQASDAITAQQPTNATGEQTPQKVEQGKPNIQQEAVNAALINAGKQILMDGVNQYGNITGNYAIANTINASLTLGADALMLAKAGVVGLIAVGTKYTLNFINAQIEQKHADIANAKALERSGNLALYGSRYTNG